MRLHSKAVAILIMFLFLIALVVPMINGNITLNEPTPPVTSIRQIDKDSTIHQMDLIYSDNHDISYDPLFGFLSGCITDIFNNPLRGVRVRVSFHSTYKEDYTDTFGYYNVSPIPKCYCYKDVIVVKEGYNTISKSMPIGDTIMNFTLTPENILYVDDDGTADYTSIQDAIDNASYGDTVFVYNGTYHENVYIHKPLVLQGEDKDTTFIDGGGSGNVVEVDVNWVTISSFTIQNGYKSIWISDSSNNNTIIGNIVTSKGYSIWISSSSNNNAVIGNTITDNHWDGIMIEDGSSRNTIIENTIDANRFGIHLSESSGNNISNNIFKSNGIMIAGDRYIESWNSHIIKNNIANGRPIRYYKNMDNVTFPCDTAQVILANCSNFCIKNLNLSDVDIGIQLGFSSNNTITENVINNNYGGIRLYCSLDNTITENIITDNFCSGIWQSGSSRNTIIENTIDNNYYGIRLYFSYNITIRRNTIQNNEYGIEIINPSDGTKIYQNNFIDNNNSALNKKNTEWDNGRIGNYWDDYKEKYPDAHRRLFRPWIWNKPYDIPGDDNSDNFPLSIPYSEDNLIFILTDFFHRLFNFDWQPAKEPYDIPFLEV